MARKSNYAAMLMCILCLTASRFAHADHADPFIQVTCSPELDYFSLRTFDIEDTDVWNDTDLANKIKSAVKPKGIFDLEDFTKIDYQCELPAEKISLKLVKYIPMNLGKCYENNATFDIWIDDKKAYSFDVFGSSCENKVHQIEFHHIKPLTSGESGLLEMWDCQYINPLSRHVDKDAQGSGPVCSRIDLSSFESPKKPHRVR